MQLANPGEIFEFIETSERAAEPIRMQLGQGAGINACYFEGIQFLREMRGEALDSRLGRLPVNYSPDARKLRAQANEVTRFVEKSQAGTHPKAIYMDCRPPERDTSADASFRADVHETVTNSAVDDAGYLAAARSANKRRCIYGAHGLGLSIESAGSLGRRVCAFDFPATCLITDPHVQKEDLWQHPYVIYADTWTRDRIIGAFPELESRLRPEDMQTIEQLEPQKIEWAQLSGSKLFSKYARFSKSKGARIYQVHVRDGYRFDKWHVVIEVKKGERILVTEDDDTCPFGGETGLPLVLLHGYSRSDTMWSWGEVAQLRETQDKRNLVETLKMRVLRNYAALKWRVDTRTLNRDVNADDMRQSLDNQIGGMVLYTGSDRVRGFVGPEPMQMPAPPPFLDAYMESYSDNMREQIHKAPGNFGQTQTHVPAKTTMRVLDDADQVASARVDQDVESHQYLVAVLHGTTIKLAQEKNLATIGMLRKNGLDGRDFSVVIGTDWRNPQITLTVQESSIRNVSHGQRMQNLDRAAELQMVTPDEYKQAKADDLPLEGDRQMRAEIGKSVMDIVAGAPWQPRPLGRWNQMFVDECIRAQMSPRAKQDPQALQRLALAIQSQQQMQSQEMLAANPELAAKVAAASGGGTPEAQPEQQGPQPGQSVSVADLIGILSQPGASNVGRQPVAA